MLESQPHVDLPPLRKYGPIRISTGDAKAKGAREVKPEPLSEFSSDRYDGHGEVNWLCCLRCRSANGSASGTDSRAKQHQSVH
jgi:hypothetical protein